MNSSVKYFLIERNDPNQISNLLDFESANYSSTISENDHEYSKQFSVIHEETPNLNESRVSDNKSLREFRSYEADSYNSFNFESRVANYGKKSAVVLQEDYNSANSYMSNTGFTPQAYVAPIKKNVEYSPEDYPSNATDQNDYRNRKNADENGYSDFESNNHYSNQLNNLSITKNKKEPAVLNPDMENSVYDSNSHYYMSEVDPK
jgi:hypothetical protein